MLKFNEVLPPLQYGAIVTEYALQAYLYQFDYSPCYVKHYFHLCIFAHGHVVSEWFFRESANWNRRNCLNG